MNPLTAELDSIVSDLTAAGLPATTDPGRVLTVVTTNGLAVLVGPTQEYIPILGGWTPNVLVRLITSGPDDHAAQERLAEALWVAGPVLLPAQPVIPGTWDGSDTDMPALLILAPRIVCP